VDSTRTDGTRTLSAQAQADDPMLTGADTFLTDTRDALYSTESYNGLPVATKNPQPGRDIGLCARAPSRVTACVVVKDRLDMMGDCLDALAVQEGVDYDVVVIDNGSSDGTYEMLAERAESFPVAMAVLRVPGPIGGARQAAVDHATAELIAFTDSDCIPAPDWLRHLVAAFDDETLDVVQGRTDPVVEPSGRWPKTISIGSWTDRYETCNIAYRASALEAAGGFDPAAELGGEDTTAGWRVRRLGRRHAYAEQAVVHHAVTYPGLRWHHRFARDLAMWPALVRDFPELRETLLHNHFFLRERSAAFDLAALGVALVAGRKPLGALLVLPYARLLRPAWKADGPRGAAEVLSYDANTAAGLIAGSWRARTVVL
jgi:glycosyltransferase involved in cell wall biosynthesis